MQKKRSKRVCRSCHLYGCRSVNLAIDRDDVQGDLKKQKMIAKGFIQLNYETIKKNSCHPKEGFDPHWIQEMIYHEIHAAFHMDVIKDAIEDVRQVVHSYKRRKRTAKQLKKDMQRLERNVAKAEISVQTDPVVEKK